MDDLQHFGWSHYEWLLWKVLYVASHKERIFHRKCDLVEYDVFRVRKKLVSFFS